MKREILILAAGLTALAAHADPITPSQAEDVIEAAGATLSASEASGEFSHAIDARIGDVNITVRLGGCDADTGLCNYAMMFSTFDLGQKANEQTLFKTNSYNDSYPFGRAFVIPGQDDSGDIVGVDYVIDLSGEASLDPEDIGMFQEILSSYVTHWTGTNAQ